MIESFETIVLIDLPILRVSERWLFEADLFAWSK